MRTLALHETEVIQGGGFWGGVACGMSLVGAFFMWTSPDPFSKVAAVAYTSAGIGCAAAYF